MFSSFQRRSSDITRKNGDILTSKKSVVKNDVVTHVRFLDLKVNYFNILFHVREMSLMLKVR